MKNFIYANLLMLTLLGLMFGFIGNGPGMIVYAQDQEPVELKYPEAKDGLDYYQTTFPKGLRYSESWYGTFGYAPPAEEILLFDDDKGICIFAMKKGIRPTGEQGGTELTSLTKDKANEIIKGYSLRALCEPYDAEITDIMEHEDYFLGAQSGDKLRQKFSQPKNINEKRMEATETNKAYIEPTLTARQIEAKEAFEQAHKSIGSVDLTKFDPPRYWIAGTGNWTDATCWSNTTGGAGGASIPTSADSVYFDANSFSGANQTVTVNATANCLDMDWTGANNTPTFKLSGYCNIYGNLTLINSMSIPGTAYELDFRSTITGKTITTNNLSIGCYFVFYGSGGSWILQDNLTLSVRSIQINNGNFISNNKTLDVKGFTIEGSGSKTVTLGSSVVNTTLWRCTGTNANLTANTATINISGTGDFNGGNLTTYNNINLTGTSHVIYGNNTISRLALSSGTTQAINFTAATTQTVANVTLDGSSGHVHTLRSSSAGSPWTINKTGGGTITADWLAITDSAGTPASTWFYGLNSTADAYSQANGWSQVSLGGLPNLGILFTNVYYVSISSGYGEISWDAIAGAPTYMVRGRRSNRPISATDGYLVYIGTETMWTLANSQMYDEFTVFYKSGNNWITAYTRKMKVK